MRPLLSIALTSLLLASAAGVKAQSDLVSCEDFGFNTPMGCLDGLQPTAGPAPSAADTVEPIGPDGWGFGPGPELVPGFGLAF